MKNKTKAIALATLVVASFFAASVEAVTTNVVMPTVATARKGN